MTVQTLWKRAIIENVPVPGNPKVLEEIEAALIAMGIVGGAEKFLDYFEERPFVRMGGESYGAVFTVKAWDPYVGPVKRTVYAKAIIGGFGEEGTALTVRTQVERLRLLSAWGIRTPRVYGHGNGTIYEEFVAGRALDPVSYADVGELARIAAILDFRGAKPLTFLSDLLDRDGALYYVDVGCDLGHIADGMPPCAERRALASLLAAVPGRTGEARAAYGRHYAQQGGKS